MRARVESWRHAVERPTAAARTAASASFASSSALSLPSTPLCEDEGEGDGEVEPRELREERPNLLLGVAGLAQGAGRERGERGEGV